MKDTNPFCFGIPSSLTGENDNCYEPEFDSQLQDSYEWHMPIDAWEQPVNFGTEDQNEKPLFYFDNKNSSETGARNFKQYFENALSKLKNEDSLSDAGVKLLSDEKFEVVQIAEQADKEILDKYVSTDSKSDKISERKDSTEYLDSVSESKSKDLEAMEQEENDKIELGEQVPNCEPDVVEQKIDEDEDQKPDNDPDF
jgi:hypothetical protein